MEQADVFITHGGINSINESHFLKQVPLIVIPQHSDQFGNAKQIEKFGAGIALDNNNTKPEILRNSVKEILENIEKYKKGIEIIYQSFIDARNKRKEIYQNILK